MIWDHSWWFMVICDNLVWFIGISLLISGDLWWFTGWLIVIPGDFRWFPVILMFLKQVFGGRVILQQRCHNTIPVEAGEEQLRKQKAEVEKKEKVLFQLGTYIDLEVSWNRGIPKFPKSSILMVFSIVNHPFWGTPILKETFIYRRFSCWTCGSNMISHVDWPATAQISSGSNFVGSQIFVVKSVHVSLTSGSEFKIHGVSIGILKMDCL